MAKRYWNGKGWRRISDAEARFRQKRGQDVVDDAADTADEAPTAPAAKKPALTPAKAPALPPTPPPAPPAPIVEPPKLPDPPQAAQAERASIVLEFKNSSNLRTAELGADGILLVTFANGQISAYANFTPALMVEWEAAQSAGGWFHHNVRQKSAAHPVVGSKPAPTPGGAG